MQVLYANSRVAFGLGILIKTVLNVIWQENTRRRVDQVATSFMSPQISINENAQEIKARVDRFHVGALADSMVTHTIMAL